MPYSFTVTYQPGSENSADFLSRSNPLTSSHEYKGEEHINVIVSKFLPQAIPLSVIQEATAEDTILQTVMAKINTDNFDNKDKKIRPYFTV